MYLYFAAGFPTAFLSKNSLYKLLNKLQYPWIKI